MVGVDAPTDRVDAAIDLLWSMLIGPVYTAFVELWVAARTHPDLAGPLVFMGTVIDVAPDLGLGTVLTRPVMARLKRIRVLISILA